MATITDPLTTKIPPQSLEAERAVLGALLLEPDAWPRISARLRADDFFKEGHRTIFAAMARTVAVGHGLDLVTLSEALRQGGVLDEIGGPAYLSGLLEEAALLTRLDDYVTIVLEKARLRDLIRLSRETIARAFENGQPAFEILTRAAGDLEALTRRAAPTAPESRTLAVQGGGDLLAQEDTEPVAYITDLLSDDGGGWLAGEEKLGKSWYMLHEALCLAFGWDVCGRFPVAERRRVLLLEEEDSPRRVRRRLRALLRGHDLDPDAPEVRDSLNAWCKLSVWSGFSFDNPAMLTQLRDAISSFKPAVVYVDCLRKVTLRDLNKLPEAQRLLDALDDLRREFACVFRLVHHYRKQQGFRTGRGSQEIGGSFTLGAWGENSLFFEPIGRKAGAVRIEVQAKDTAPVPGFRLRLETEGPTHAPTLVRLLAEDDIADTDLDDLVFDAVASISPDPDHPPHQGTPGVTFEAIQKAVKRSEKPVRSSLKRLVAAGRCAVTGTTTKQAKLYAVKTS